MATRTIRARVRGPRLLELLEDIDLPDGTDVVLTIEVAEEPATIEQRGKVEFGEHDIGFQFPVDRAELHDDAPAPRRLGIYPLGAPANLTRKDYYDDDDDQ